jgi:hypothetical protein
VFTILLRQVLEDQNLDQNVLVLDIQKVYLLFEKNFKTEPLISIVCCGLMSEMLSQDQQQSAFILQKFSQPNTLQILKDMIDIKIPKKQNISLVNGINYGCQHEGYYDHPIVFFHNISQQFFMDQRMNKERKQEFLHTVSQIKLDDQIMHFLMNISSKSDVSPSGFIKMLMFIHDEIQNEQKEFMQKIFKVSTSISHPDLFFCAF